MVPVPVALVQERLSDGGKLTVSYIFLAFVMLSWQLFLVNVEIWDVFCSTRSTSVNVSSQCDLHSMLFVLVHISLDVVLSETGSIDILWCYSYFYCCCLVGDRLDWHLMVLFIFLLMLSCRRPARLSSYVVCSCSYVSWCQLVVEHGSIVIICKKKMDTN